MKRARDASWDGRVALEPRDGQLWHVDAEGQETVLDSLNRSQLYSELAKRSLLTDAHADTGADHQQANTELIMAMFAGAKEEMNAAATMVQQMARDNKTGCLQQAHLPYRRPLVSQEAPVLQGALSAKRAAFQSCCSLLRSAADSLRAESTKDSRYFHDLKKLNKKWPLASGIEARFGCDRSAFVEGEAPSVALARQESGSVQVAARNARNLYVNQVAVFRTLAVQEGCHAALLRASCSYRARAMLSLVKFSTEHHLTCFGNEQVQVNDLLFSVGSMDQPSERPTTGVHVVHVLLMQMLADFQTLAHRSALPIIGVANERLLLLSRRSLSRIVGAYQHVNLIHDINDRLRAKLRVRWNKTEVTDGTFHSISFIFSSSVVHCCLFSIVVRDGMFYIDGKQSTLAELEGRISAASH